MISSGPAIRTRKKSNAPRSVSLILKCKLIGEAVGDGVREGFEEAVGDDLESRDMVVDEAASLLAERLLDVAGRSGRDVALRSAGSDVKPSHSLPAEEHFKHTGRVSSHFTRLSLSRG